MNNNVPESERWVPVKADVPFFVASSSAGKRDIGLDRARREAEAVITDRFKQTS